MGRRRCFVAAAVVVFFAAELSRAADLIQVETATPPVPLLRRAAELLPAGEPGGGIDAVLEPSAVAPLDRDGRLLLVVDDKVNGLVIVDAATGARARSCSASN